MKQGEPLMIIRHSDEKRLNAAMEYFKASYRLGFSVLIQLLWLSSGWRKLCDPTFRLPSNFGEGGFRFLNSSEIKTVARTDLDGVVFLNEKWHLNGDPG